MVTFTDSDDRRSAYLRNKAIQNANTVRERRATVENPQWAMSRDADWYTELDDQGELSNLRSVKDTLANQQGNRDFWTTDQDEGRNMYQMLMNQMKGGDKGARMLDTRGLPAGARRTGRTLFTDPAKSQGFFGDVESLFTGKNKAAVRAQEYNPFPKSGFGEQVYKDKFPIASGLDSLMGLAEKSPTFNMLASMFPKSNRVPLERDLSWVPEGVGEYNKIPEIPFMEDITETIEEEEPLISPPGIPAPFDDEVTITDLPDITETITEDDGEEVITNVDEIFENEDVFNRVFEFVQDRGAGPDLPTAWEHMQKMRDLLGWDEERMLEHLINNGVLRERP